MADGKKSFVLYTDYNELFSELSDQDAGQLIKHILAYVNDENPKSDNPIVNISFIPIKLQLKRDLVKWDALREKRSEAGKASAEAKKNKSKQNQQVLNVLNTVEQTSTNSTVTVNDTVTVNVTDLLLEKEAKADKPIKKKKEFTPPSLSDVKEYFLLSGYSDYAAKKAFEYYDAAQWHDAGGKPVLNWKQKMISVWFKPENMVAETINSEKPQVFSPKRLNL